jgi:hypothetical protein
MATKQIGCGCCTCLRAASDISATANHKFFNLRLKYENRGPLFPSDDVYIGVRSAWRWELGQVGSQKLVSKQTRFI